MDTARAYLAARAAAHTVLWLSLCMPAAPPAAAETTLARRVDALLAPLVAARQFSGAVVLVRDGQVAYERGFGVANHQSGTPFTPDTPSDGGSLAKTFTAAGIQWLAHEGRVELDAPVTRYVAEFPHPQTTVRQLVSHSNGLPPYYEFFDPHFGKDEVRTTEALLAVVARQAPRPSFPPGTRFEYSNLGFDAAALVIERVSGRRYADFVAERFFAPLGMARSFARPARLADWRGVRTAGYRWRGGAWRPFDAFDMEAFLGASNLYFPATDLARWAAANAAGKALPPAVFATGQVPPTTDGRPSPITGLSWYCSDDGERCHYTGSLNAFHALVYWDRGRNQAAAFVSNSALPPWQTISLQRALVDTLAGRSAAVPAAPPPLRRMAGAAKSAAAGSYVAAGIGRITVRSGPAGLRLRVGDGLEFDAFPVGDGVFYVPGPDWWIGFSRGGARPAALHLRGMYVDTVAPRMADGGG